ncbi:MAG TPA: peptide-methionine (S)-S-oxide reductase MsrA [Candidatus Acidoferrum sp.]|nr:peptide-methionine (S)-S-oxide reductase MsrA [Candidatus Acidoferrum sp.]
MSEQREIATFAGGCFWCLEAVFQRIKGIKSALPGYAGGTVENPTYEQVCTGKTGHAETIQIKFDPAQISYDELLDIFWHTHNPTTRNRQNNDVGPEYRSVIFYHDEAQHQAALKSKAKFEKEAIYNDPIVTEIIPYTNFYEAEDYHKNYYERHRGQAYCDIIIEPKVKELLAKFGADVKAEYK